MSEAIVVRGWLTRRVKEEAEKLGVSVEEYLVELLSQGLDPKDRAVEYVDAAESLLDEAREELGKGNVRQAAEKLWGATALTVKAYAYWRIAKGFQVMESYGSIRGGWRTSSGNGLAMHGTLVVLCASVSTRAGALRKTLAQHTRE